MLNSIRENAGYLKGRLLDFGCGSKPYKSLFEVEEYIGVDFYNEGHSHEEEDIDVYYDGKNLPFENASFDSILCSEVFEHIFNLEEIIKELHRVLRPDGTMLITCPFVWNEHEVPYDFARYTRFALKAILERNGFELVHHQKAGNFITTICQMWVLYWHTILYTRCKKYLPLRIVYKAVFVLLPNVAGTVLNKLLPENSSLYLNNVVVAKKIKNG